MWKYPNDNTRAVITAKEHIQSGHNPQNLCLPQTAVLFYMHSGEEYLRQNYPTHLLCEKLPRFLRGCPVAEYGKVHTELKGKYIHRTARQL